MIRTTDTIIRDLRPAETSAFGATLHTWLRPDSAITAEEDCPLLLGRRARSLRLIAERDGRPAAHAALFIHRLRLPQGLLRVGVIGGVATAPELRGQGLASAVLTQLIHEASLRSVDVLVLWASEPGVYERVGFVRAGREWLAAIPTPVGSDTARAAGRVRPATERDLPALARLHDAEPVATLRSMAMWEELLSIPGMSVLVHESGEASRYANTADPDAASDAVDAYAACGKGLDLQGCIHEWAGSIAALMPLASAAARTQALGEIILMGAPHQAAAIPLLEQQGASVIHGALGMVRVLQPADLAARWGIALPSPARNQCPMPSASDQCPMPPPDQCPERVFFGSDATPGPIPLYLKGLDSM